MAIYKVFVLLLCVGCINPMDTTKEAYVIYQLTEHNRAIKMIRGGSLELAEKHVIDHAGSRKSLPQVDGISMKPVSEATAIDMPESNVIDKIEPIQKEDVVDNSNCCTPAKAFVIASICTGLAGVVTGVLTAAVTLVIHFTTK